MLLIMHIVLVLTISDFSKSNCNFAHAFKKDIPQPTVTGSYLIKISLINS